MTDAAADGDVYELRVAGALDRHAAEALRLELRRLARAHGVEVEVRVEKAPAAPPPSAYGGVLGLGPGQPRRHLHRPKFPDGAGQVLGGQRPPA
jgi:hypothetical protein